jgi:hypothetical protein
MVMEPAGVRADKTLLYFPVYYGTPESLFEFFSQYALDERARDAVRKHLRKTGLETLGFTVFDGRNSLSEVFNFRAYSEEVLENAYIGFRNILKGEHSAW